MWLEYPCNISKRICKWYLLKPCSRLPQIWQEIFIEICNYLSRSEILKIISLERLWKLYTFSLRMILWKLYTFSITMICIRIGIEIFDEEGNWISKYLSRLCCFSFYAKYFVLFHDRNSYFFSFYTNYFWKLRLKFILGVIYTVKAYLILGKTIL